MHASPPPSATKARAKHHEFVRRGERGIYRGLTFWSPNINIFRDPRWGRGQETYGEDPFLTARMGVAFVEAMQGDDPKYCKTVATAKHYAVHSGPEAERHAFDVSPSERDLHETYLPAFQALVQEAKVASVMGAYNRVNGESASASPRLLGQILRGDWGFNGYVVSDCGAIDDIYKGHKIVATAEAAAALAVKQGCDLELRHHLPVAEGRGGAGPDRREGHRRRGHAPVLRALQAGDVRSARARPLCADAVPRQRVAGARRARPREAAGSRSCCSRTTACCRSPRTRRRSPSSARTPTRSMTLVGNYNGTPSRR